MKSQEGTTTSTKSINSDEMGPRTVIILCYVVSKVFVGKFWTHLKYSELLSNIPIVQFCHNGQLIIRRCEDIGKDLGL